MSQQQTSNLDYARAYTAGMLLLFAVIWQGYLFGSWLVYEGMPRFDLASLVAPLLIAVAFGEFVSAWRSIHSFPAQHSLRKTDLPVGICLGWGVLGACVSALVLLSSAPASFSAFAAEDRLVESLSAALALIGSLAFIGVLFMHGKGHETPLVRILLLAAGIVAALIGLEEVSWFQRQLDFETPAFLAGNLQAESNLHNLHTEIFENGYYFAAFVVFVFVPFLHAQVQTTPSWIPPQLIPGMAPFVPAAMASSFSYDMWHGVPTQVMFWGSLSIVACGARAARSSGSALLLWACFVLMLISQAVFLAKGDTTWRIWDVTEYREALIAGAIFVYAGELWLRTRRQQVAAVQASFRYGHFGRRNDDVMSRSQRD